MYKNLLVVSVSLALSACAIGPDYQRPPTDFPDRFQEKTAVLPEDVLRVEPKWWLNYNDPVLNAMVEQALSYNNDLAVAVAQMDDAAAQARVARSALLPQINATGNGTRGRTSQETNTGALGESYTVGASVSWELDLWGKLRRSNEAARATYLASSFNADAVRLSLAAQVAQTYFQMRALDASLKLSQDTRRTREETLDIQTKRFQGGVLSMLEVSQAQAELSSAQLSAEQQALALKTTETALSVLLGQSPREFLNQHPRGSSLNAMSVPSNIPEGVPSDLLLRRPDIAQAEQQLVAANARIGEARAAYFPSIGLTGNLGSQSLSLANLFTGPAATWSFIGSLAAPIFNFGATQANVSSANARQRSALAAYEKAIQSGFKDVLDSLRTVDSTRMQLRSQRDQVNATQEALRLVNLRYNAGYSAYLDVLDTQRSAYAAQLGLINTELSNLNATVNLYKALGGGWQKP